MHVVWVVAWLGCTALKVSEANVVSIKPSRGPAAGAVPPAAPKAGAPKSTGRNGSGTGDPLTRPQPPQAQQPREAVKALQPHGAGLSGNGTAGPAAQPQAPQAPHAPQAPQAQQPHGAGLSGNGTAGPAAPSQAPQAPQASQPPQASKAQQPHGAGLSGNGTAGPAARPQAPQAPRAPQVPQAPKAEQPHGAGLSGNGTAGPAARPQAPQAPRAPQAPQASQAEQPHGAGLSGNGTAGPAARPQAPLAPQAQDHREVVKAVPGGDGGKRKNATDIGAHGKPAVHGSPPASVTSPSAQGRPSLPPVDASFHMRKAPFNYDFYTTVPQVALRHVPAGGPAPGNRSNYTRGDGGNSTEETDLNDNEARLIWSRDLFPNMKDVDINNEQDNQELQADWDVLYASVSCGLFLHMFMGVVFPDFWGHSVCLVYWVVLGLGFNAYIYYQFGLKEACMWATGYLLEWMLSLDNLFVFHLIFTLYKTPKQQIDKAIFAGVFFAVILRIFFFSTVACLLSLLQWIRFIFGGLLVYSGIQALCENDDEEVSEMLLVSLLTKMLGSRLRKTYDPAARIICWDDWQDGVHFSLLFPVVLSLEVTDIVFALDSVTAKIGLIPDQFLAVSSTAFAIFGLRGLFFILNDLIDMFELLKYGLSIILIFIGMEMCFHPFLDLSPQTVFVVIMAVFLVCMIGSATRKLRPSRPEGPETTPRLKGLGSGISLSPEKAAWSPSRKTPRTPRSE